MQRTERKISDKTGLQIKMTVYVTSAVLLVTAVILSIMAFLIRKDYVRMLDDRISDDLAAITQNIEQRVLRMEDAISIMANLSSIVLEDGSDADSILCRTLNSMDDVHGVAMVFRDSPVTGRGGYVERYACLDPEGGVLTGSHVFGDRFVENAYWRSCYNDGRSVWSDPTKDGSSGLDIVYYAVPLYSLEHERIGMSYVSVPLSRITSFVTEYKVRKDIDISIYNANGNTIVAPDDYIMRLSPDELVQRESLIEHTGWKVVLSADMDIIDRIIREGMLSLGLLFFLMFIFTTLVIVFTVRHVARPFVERQREIEREKAVMDNELQLASQAQNEIVPHVFPPFPHHEGIDLSACLHPARDVGGDLYDYFISGDMLYFCIGDVSGKGLQASLFMAATHYLFRSVATGMRASDAVRQMNVSLFSDNEKCRFVTFWFGCLNLHTGMLEYVNAGHDAPLLVRGGKAEWLPASENMPLGIDGDVDFVSNTMALEPGDMMLLFTDGVTEAMDAEGHEFGKDRLFESAGDAAGDASRMIENVLDHVRSHASGVAQSDDITMLCLRLISSETK